ncbi:MAG: PKD domain-containing protein [Bacteroidota bacterium]|nr:PKD domain-containing protein [Bacteroidota bacterium]
MKTRLQLKKLTVFLLLLCAVITGRAQVVTGSVTLSNLGNGNMHFTVDASAPAGWLTALSINYGDGSSGNMAIDTGATGQIMFMHNYTSNDTFYVASEVYAVNPVDSTSISDLIYDTIVITDYSCLIDVTSISADNLAGLTRPFYGNFNTPLGNPILNWRVEDTLGVNLPISANQNYMEYTFPYYGNFKLWFSVTFTDALTSQTCADSVYVNVNVHDTVYPCNLQVNMYASTVSGLTAELNGSTMGYNYTAHHITVDGQTFYTDSIQYTFPSDGYYQVCYYAEDTTYSIGCSDSHCIIYTAGNPVVPCNAYFTLQQDSLDPTVWYGINTSTGPSTMTYLWNFGDGTSSALPALTHNYAVPGNYIICLTITDTATGCSSTHCDSSAFFSRPENANTIGSLVITAPLLVSLTENQSVFAETKVFPNPMAETSLVTFNSSLSANGKIEVVNVLGANVLSENVVIAKGNNEFKLNTSTLNNGIYYVNIIAENRVLSTVKAVK